MQKYNKLINYIFFTSAIMYYFQSCEAPKMDLQHL